MRFREFDRNFSLGGKVFLVTGGAGGIGKVIGEFFASKGARGTLADLSPEVVVTSARLGLEGVAVDLTSPDGPEHAVAFSLDKFGRLDILVNCA
ncbi:MAG: SDR family NAD(P)-dependent oxidoreductase, partial [Synergistaceae bacterium]|nr:SDR family NAD(P)-dependent oxidoreductase [Synergistaceae bacterium]